MAVNHSQQLEVQTKMMEGGLERGTDLFYHESESNKIAVTLVDCYPTYAGGIKVRFPDNSVQGVFTRRCSFP